MPSRVFRSFDRSGIGIKRNPILYWKSLVAMRDRTMALDQASPHSLDRERVRKFLFDARPDKIDLARPRVRPDHRRLQLVSRFRSQRIQAGFEQPRPLLRGREKRVDQ